ncbi:MAG: iron ABC transporter permease, partial [Mangrovicoccus sp.]
MAETPSSTYGLSALRQLTSPWTLAALLIGCVVLLPIATVLALSLQPGDGLWAHLVSTTLPRYLSNTLLLMVLVGGFSALAGTVTAWLVTMFRFPGERWLQYLLLLP